MDVKKFVVLIGLIFLGPQIARAQYKIYYIPFDVETFVPVDAEKIEKQSHFVLEYQDAAIDQAFEKIKMTTGNGQSSLVNLRAKIVRLKDQEVIFLNKPTDLLSSKMISWDDKAVGDNLRESIARKVKEACKKPKSKWVIKIKNCNLLGK